MNMSNFFEFNSKMSSPKYHAYLTGYEGVCVGLIPQDRLLLGDYEGFTFPLTFRHQKQHKSLDILDTGTGSFYLISDKMKCLLEENKLTGWKTFSIKLLDKKNIEIQGYHGLSVLGRCGPINFNNSEIVYREVLSYRPPWKFYKGYQFDLDQWDNSDFFIPKGRLRTIITEKAANILINNKINNLFLINLLDVETDNDIVQMVEKKINKNSLTSSDFDDLT